MNERKEPTWALDKPSERDLLAANAYCSHVFQLLTGKASNWGSAQMIHFQDLMDEVFGSNNFLRYSHNELLARSWIHARAQLLRSWLASNLPDVPGIDQPSDLMSRSLSGLSLLRGQRNYRWWLQPSMYRMPPGVSKKARDSVRRRYELALRVFETALSVDLDNLSNRLGEGYLPKFSTLACRAAAQHYGLATPLLDWTRHPDVALAFACEDKSAVHDELAVIFILPLSEAKRLGARIVLPPVYVERLYLQKGVFIEIAEDAVPELDDACIKMVFPREPWLLYKSLLPDQQFFFALVEWANHYAGNKRPKKAQQELFHRLLDGTVNYDQRMMLSIGAHMYVQREFNNLPPWALPDIDFVESWGFVDKVVELVESVGYKIKGNEKVLDPEVMSIVRRDNPEFFEWLASSIGNFNIINFEDGGDTQEFENRLRRLLGTPA